MEFHKRGEKQEFEFKISPASLKEGRANIRAVFESGGKNYAEGYSLVTREDSIAFTITSRAPAHQYRRCESAEGSDRRYVMGAGDDIPTVLTQIEMKVALISADKLASQDLSQYQTIVVGIRAYDTQKDLAANNKKLLDFVFSGGTLVAHTKPALPISTRENSRLTPRNSAESVFR